MPRNLIQFIFDSKINIKVLNADQKENKTNVQNLNWININKYQKYQSFENGPVKLSSDV